MFLQQTVIGMPVYGESIGSTSTYSAPYNTGYSYVMNPLMNSICMFRGVQMPVMPILQQQSSIYPNPNVPIFSPQQPVPNPNYRPNQRPNQGPNQRPNQPTRFGNDGGQYNRPKYNQHNRNNFGNKSSDQINQHVLEMMVANITVQNIINITE